MGRPLNIRTLPALALAMALPCHALIAQEHNEAQAPQRPPERPLAHGQQPSQNFENYLKSIKKARAEQIKMRLNVPQERADAIADKWAELEAPIRRIHMESMDAWRQMQFIIQDASPEKEKSTKIKPLLDQYTELHKELAEARLRLYRELPTMARSPIQQARILLVMEEMERKERDGIKTFIERRGKGPRPQGGTLSQ
jgi:hypothetical protein